MKKPLLSVLFLSAVSLALSSQQLPIIIVVNNTGFTINSIYISPANSDTWGQEILRGGILQKSSYILEVPGQQGDVPFRYDILLKTNDGLQFIKWNVDIIDNAQIVFTADDLVKGDDIVVPVTPVNGINAGGIYAARDAIVKAAQRYLGARYVYGSQLPPEKFDCSGLVNQAYKEGANIAIPRSSSEIWVRGKRINKADLAPGDIIVFSENKITPSHVAIYIDETYMIHSVSIGSPTGVVQSRQSEGSWSRKIIGYVTFVGVQSAGSASVMGPAITEFPVLAASFINRSTDVLAAQAKTGMSFVVTNGIGENSEFDIFFYKAGSNRTSGERETLFIANGASKASRAFFFAEKGQYRLEIASRANNRTLLEYTFNVEE